MARGLALGLCLLGCLLGCARVTPHARTVDVIRVNLELGDFESLAYVTGSDCAARYLVFFRFSSPNIVRATEAAMRKAPGSNFLANRHVTVEEEFRVPLLYHRLCVVVEARAIKLHTALEEGM